METDILDGLMRKAVLSSTIVLFCNQSMTINSKQKIYCYADETGQDTKGRLFLVSVIVGDKELDRLREIVEQIEQETGKRHIKWQKTNHAIRVVYLDRLIQQDILKGKVCFSVYKQTQAYVDLTILTVAKSILRTAKDDYKASVFVDGLNKTEIRKFTAGLRKLHIHTRKVRGLRDESDALIRLADAFCGFLRDYIEGKDYAKELYDKAKHKGILVSVE